jgi:UDP-N-acetylglucosamine 2-epimerase
MRVATIVGARPEFIQLAPVSRALRRFHEECLIHTGQHYDVAMSEQFFQELSLPLPDYQLDCGSGLHGEQTARMLERVEQALLKEQPDWVVVFGDTNSTLAGALAAAKLHIPLAHVEAGLRSFNREMPEEINRVVADHISDHLFCPTETARINLLREGIIRGVELVGDVMYDIHLLVKPLLEERAQALLRTLHVAAHRYLLVTIHRPANTDNAGSMRNIATALNHLDLPIIFPIHPRTRKRLAGYDISWGRHILLIEPVGFLDMLALERYAYRILTDSGGVQKQAFISRVPCITLREETEWRETVESGWNVLVGSCFQAILDAVALPAPPDLHPNPFGDGQAAKRIVQSLSSHSK